MKKIALLTVLMCAFASSINADDCVKKDGTSREGTLTDTSVLPSCDENVASAQPAVQQQSMYGVAQQKVKVSNHAQGKDKLAKKQHPVE